MLRMILVLIVFGVGTVAGLQSAVLASCFFIWNDTFRPAEWAYYHGILRPETFKAVHIATAVLALSLFIRPWKRRWNGVATAMVVFLGWVFVCALTSQLREIGMEKAVTTAKYMIPLAFISATLCTRSAQHLFLYTLAASVGIWMVHHGVNAILANEPEIHMAIRGGQMSDRNDFMVAGTACIPMILYIGFQYEGRARKWVRLLAKVGAVFSAGALFFSLSRGAVLGFTALLLWYAVSTGRFFRRLFTVVAVIGLLVLVMPKFVWERMSTIEVSEDQTETSATNRLIHMKTAIDVTLDYPLTGVGPSNFPYVSSRYSVFNAEPHSLWLKCSSEYGLPMLVFFLLLVGRLIFRLRATATAAKLRGDRQTEALATTLSCALFGFLATGSFTSQFLSEYMWAIIGLIGAFLATPILHPAPEAGPSGEESPALRAGGKPLALPRA